MSYDVILQLQKTNGIKNKVSMLADWKDNDYVKQFLYYAMNPMLSYRMSEKTLRTAMAEYDGTQSVFFKDIFDCCSQLSRLRGMDDATVRQVVSLLYRYGEEERELYVQLLTKTFRTGLTGKSINKAIPDLIPDWEVQQAFAIEKHPIAEGTEFWLTQKMNGIRATFYNGQFIGRQGNVFEGLDHIKIKMEHNINTAPFVFDGELTLMNVPQGMSENEAFRTAAGIMNNDSKEKPEIMFTIFDMVTKADFDSGEPKMDYRQRRAMMDGLALAFNKQKQSPVKFLPCLYHGKDQSQIYKLLDRMVSEDKEGLMLNTNCEYKRTRHKGILKVKQFYTMDLPIIGFEEGSGRCAGTLGSLVVDFDGNRVEVGTGFSDAERDAIWDGDKESLIGKICEVKYKEISTNKRTGKRSLQFPVFVRIRDDKDTVSVD